MSLSENEIHSNEVEKQLVAKLGRELTAREKFYLALSEVCAPSNGISAEEDTAKIEAAAREEQEEIKRELRRTIRIYQQSQTEH
jgi:O-phosphoseryl-tRNA(Cys) synthetase